MMMVIIIIIMKIIIMMKMLSDNDKSRELMNFIKVFTSVLKTH